MTRQPPIGLAQLLIQRTERAPGRKALSFEGSTWTYGELQGRIDRMAGALAAGGVGPGDRVVFLAFNHPLFLVTLYACARIGAIFVPPNFRLTAAELEFIINDAGAHTLIAGPDHRALIDTVRASLDCRAYWTYDGSADGWGSVEALMAAAPPVGDPWASSEDDVAVIMYTSGTTGRPKGAMLTHGNFWWNAVNGMLIADALEDDVHLGCAPLFHIGGLNSGLMTTLLKGGHVVLQKGFEPAGFLADVARYQATTSFAVPAMLLFVSQHPAFAQADLSSLRMIAVGGAPVPEALLALFNSRGIPVQQGYGLTETAPTVSFLAPEWSRAKLGSAGKPPLLTQIRLVDGQGAVITEPLARGEICVRGPNVMLGYWNRPDATREAIDEDGWFRTGDIGYVDADGFYYICDRVKDMVISGGENVYPAEVESVLYEHPAIAEVAVIGLPDQKWGETVVAVAALKPGATLTLDELQAFAGRKLARYKIPRQLKLLDLLPRNPTGKILKFKLREQLAVKSG